MAVSRVQLNTGWNQQPQSSGYLPQVPQAPQGGAGIETYIPRTRTQSDSTIIGPRRRTVTETRTVPPDPRDVRKEALARDLPGDMAYAAIKDLSSLKRLKDQLVEYSQELKDNKYPVGTATPARLPWDMIQYMSGGDKFNDWLKKTERTFQREYRIPVTGAQAGVPELKILRLNMPSALDKPESYHRITRSAIKEAMQGYNDTIEFLSETGTKTGSLQPYNIQAELDEFDEKFLKGADKGAGAEKLLKIIEGTESLKGMLGE